jgi:hypothetical protein
MAGFSYNIVIEYLQCCVQNSVEENILISINDSNTTGAIWLGSPTTSLQTVVEYLQCCVK